MGPAAARRRVPRRVRRRRGHHLPGRGHGRPRRPLRRPVRPRPPGRRRHRPANAAPTSRPSCTSPSRTRCNGVTTSVNLTTDVRCHTCSGTGAAPGTQPVTCPRCGGTGTLQDNQGLFSLSQICPQCGGRGTVVTTPCPTCSGTGVEHRNRTVKVRIPPGVEDGQRIRVKGRGAAGRGNAPERRPLRGGPGGPPRRLRAPGPQPDPDRARLLPRGRPSAPPSPSPPSPSRSPSGCRPAPRRAGPSGSRAGACPPARRAPTGDLLVTVEVAVPDKLTDEQRAAVEALAEVVDPPARDVLGV